MYQDKSDINQIESFKKKYGTRTLGLLVGSFIKRSPEFDGGVDLAKEIGKMIGDLESALES